MLGRWVGKRARSAFVKARNGNVAMLWALMGTVLVGLVGLTVDFARAQAIRVQMQNAVDGAALVAERAAVMTEEQRVAAARAFFDAEMGDLTADVTEFTVTDLGDVGHRVEAAMPIELTLARLVRNQPWTVRAESEAEQGGRDIEVAIVLDTTGSMAGNRITDLRAAATDLVNTVVSDEQEPFTSRAALVPYSIAVNAGTFAPVVRGTLTGGRPITNVAWANSTARSISAATRQNPVRVTANNHGLTTNDRVRIYGGSNGMSQIRNNNYTVTVVDSNTFTLNGVNGTSYTAYTSGMSVARCINTNCEVVVTAAGHDLANNEYVYITGVNGMTQVNNTVNSGAGAAWQITRNDANSFVLNGSNSGTTYTNAYTSGGTSNCTRYGCEYFRFLNPSNTQRRFRATDNCVTERTGANAYTDVAPSTALVGIHYPNGGSGNDACGSAAIMPLTSDRTALNGRIAALTATGYTAGQIGVGWGYYMLSPNFGSIFTGEGVPQAYDAEAVLKVAVIMTDGEFNTHYCNGVVSSNSSSVSSSNRINCNAQNGTGFSQAVAMCTRMKNDGIVIYTVGFDVGSNQDVQDTLEDCASSAGHYYQASNGTQLRAAFQSIARAIQQLRLTH